jgi:hypothetical protein
MIGLVDLNCWRWDTIMIRHFKFEDEVHQSLSCVPMAVRRKLDRIGLKIGLEQWQQLSRGERLAVCHLPIDSSEEQEVVRTFMREAVQTHSGGVIKELPEEARRTATPPASPPTTLVAHARAAGVALGQREWERLDEDERYALIKLGGAPTPSHNLAAALDEFLNHSK